MPTDRKATQWMARQLKWLKEYPPKRELTGATQHSRQQLADYAAGTTHLGHATVALGSLAVVRSAAGCVAVLAGDDQGWSEVDIACLYNYWVIRLLARSYDLNQRLDKQGNVLMDRVATCWMHAEAVGATKIRQWLDKLIVETAAGYPGVIGRDMNALCTLVAHYATGRDVADLERSGWDAIDVYAPVAGGTFTADGYDALATYHQHQVDGDAYPPFHSYPYSIVPFELLAISRRTGIPIKGDHPLLTSPLAWPRSVPEIPITDELRGVLARATAELSIEPAP